MVGDSLYWSFCPSSNPFKVIVKEWDKNRKERHVNFASDLDTGRIAHVVPDSIKFKVILIRFNLELKQAIYKVLHFGFKVNCIYAE